MNQKNLLSLPIFSKLSPTLKNLSIVIVGDITSKLFTLGAIILLIRGLSVNDYAVYVSFENVAIFLSGMIGSGINTCLVRFSTEYRTKFNKTPFEIFVSGYILELAIFVLILLIGNIFATQASLLLFGSTHQLAAVQLGLWYGLGILLSEMARAFFQSEEQFPRFIGILLARQAIIFTVILILFVLHQINAGTVTLLLAIINILFGGFVVYQSIAKKIRLDLAFFKSLNFSYLLGPIGWLAGYFILLSIFSRTDVFFLSHMRTSAEVASYGVAFRYYSMGLILLGSIHSVLLPKFSNIDMQDPQRQLAFMKTWLKNSIWIVVPVAIFDLFGRNFFVWVNGNAYQASFPILVVFSIGICASIILSPLINIQIARRKFRLLFFLAIASLIFNIVGNYISSKIVGGLGVAIVVIITYLIINLGALIDLIANKLTRIGFQQ